MAEMNYDRIGACVGTANMFNALKPHIQQLAQLGLIGMEEMSAALAVIAVERDKLFSGIAPHVARVPWLSEFLEGMHSDLKEVRPEENTAGERIH